jgi:GntR family transcriptional regulator
LSHLRSFAQEMNAQGLALTTRLLSVGFAQASLDVAERLVVDGNEGVFRLERLRLIDGKPVVHQQSYLPQWLGVALRGVDLAAGSLYDALSHRDVKVTRARETLHPVTLDEREAVLLGADPGAPAIVSKRITFGGGERPILYDEAIMPGDRLVISADRFSDDVTVSYQLRQGGGESMN